MLTLKIWTELLPDAGEDAPPLLRLHPPHGLMVVSDGLGGAGSTQYEVGDRVVSGAYLASRAVVDALAALFSKEEIWRATDRDAQITEAVMAAIEMLDQQHGGEASRLKSKLIRKFPATLTVLLWEKLYNGFLQLLILNVGDSRAWVLHPMMGLQALTRDDAVGYPDALDHLHDSAPMTQVICADQSWSLRVHTATVEPDALLICGSDGCFDYLRHPAELEWLLLDQLQRSTTAEGWETALRETLLALASDDVSLVLASPDGAPLEALRQQFAQRHSWLRTHVLPVLEQLSQLDQDSAQSLKAQLWETYRTAYEQLMPSIPSEPEKPTSPSVESTEAPKTVIDIPISEGEEIVQKEGSDE